MRTRTGKYKEYEKRILRFLIKQNDLSSASQIRRNTNIPKSSFYDVLRKLNYYGYIEWIGEPQDWISEVEITKKGIVYLEHLLK
ncbi:MAG: TrmB family transcriptional regulator [Thaumarchaeota archaeon]|nr:TrmB family transcriptional regulator [Nitrososphaerota archaeon]